jgi:hypothetical protein
VSEEVDGSTGTKEGSPVGMGRPFEREQKEPWWTDARKTLVGQGLTLLLTPASVAVTYYLTEHYKAPKPSAEYVGATAYYFANVPSPELADKIKGTPSVAQAFRTELRQQPNAKCVDWLDEGEFDSECTRLYRNVALQLERAMEEWIDRIKQGRPTQNQPRAADPLIALMFPSPPETIKSIAVVKEVLKGFDDLQKQKSVRSGGVGINVGVLNKGDSDGTVFNAATLRFQGRALTVHSDKYLPVAAHAFAEVLFEPPWEDKGEYFGSRSVGEESIVKAWSDLVKKGNEIEFELKFNLSDKETSIKGSVPREE